MPQVTHVKRAQVRWPTKPVIDPATGEPVRIQLFREDGSPKLTRSKQGRPGRPIFITKTEADKSGEPEPNHVCDACRQEILPGTPYKWIKPKSGPYGGRMRTRHESCPAWQVWEYSSSLSARLAQVEHEFQEALGSAESEDDVQGALEDAANQVEEIAGEKQDGADNIESGFGHETSASQELKDTADILASWAEEIRSATVPDLPDPEDADEEDWDDCETCEGKGKITDAGEEEECPDCEGKGKTAPEEPTATQLDEWRSECIDTLTIVGEYPG